MDQKLDCKPHIERVGTKASKSVNALASLGSSTWNILELQEHRESGKLQEKAYKETRI
jgi:hypothetical protein